MKFRIPLLAGFSILGRDGRLTAGKARPGQVAVRGKVEHPVGAIHPRRERHALQPHDHKGTKFTIKYTRDGRSIGCDLNIGADGSFADKSCDAPTTGKFNGDNMDLTIQSQERICKVAFTRDKT